MGERGDVVVEAERRMSVGELQTSLCHCAAIPEVNNHAAGLLPIRKTVCLHPPPDYNADEARAIRGASLRRKAHCIVCPLNRGGAARKKAHRCTDHAEKQRYRHVGVKRNCTSRCSYEGTSIVLSASQTVSALCRSFLTQFTPAHITAVQT